MVGLDFRVIYHRLGDSNRCSMDLCKGPVYNGTIQNRKGDKL